MDGAYEEVETGGQNRRVVNVWVIIFKLGNTTKKYRKRKEDAILEIQLFKDHDLRLERKRILRKRNN